MREIKFKFAWDGQVFSVDDDSYDDDFFFQLERGTPVFYRMTMGEDKGYVREEAAVPLQFTGLKDKNGKEIYEGDCVKNLFLRLDTIHQVIFDAGCFKLKPSLNHIDDWQEGNDCPSLEVIGNIYENPELLK